MESQIIYSYARLLASCYAFVSSRVNYLQIYASSGFLLRVCFISCPSFTRMLIFSLFAVRSFCIV